MALGVKRAADGASEAHCKGLELIFVLKNKGAWIREERQPLIQGIN